MPTKNGCVLCRRSVYKNPELSLFGFPKDPKRRKIWLLKCGFNEVDVQSNRKLCSFHFAETDFGKGVKRRSLKSNAIPTIFDAGHIHHGTPSTSFEDTPCKENNNINQANTPTKLGDSDVMSVLETPKSLKRKCYIGDIKTPDLATPKRAKRSLNKARSQIISQRKKINLLHQTVRRLKKKLTMLEKLIDHLTSFIREQEFDI